MGLSCHCERTRESDDRCEVPPQEGERGIEEALLREGGRGPEASPLGDPREGMRDALKSAALESKQPVEQHTTDHAPFATHLSPQTINICSSRSCACPRTEREGTAL